MPVSDAFIVGEEFCSEHYFTSDAKNETFHARVLERRKDWDAAEHATSRSRFLAARSDLLTQLHRLYADAPEGQLPTVDSADVAQFNSALLEALGFLGPEFRRLTEGPVTRFGTAGVEESPLAIVAARPVMSIDDVFHKPDADDPTDAPLALLEPWVVDESSTEVGALKTISRLFLEPDGPEFVLLLAGRYAVLTEQARWAEGRYLAVDVQTVLDRKDDKRGGEIDRALTILDADSLAPDPDGRVWWAGTLTESIKHTVGVSKDLREGVRASIEIIANEVVARRRAQGLPPLPADQAQPLARQSLRFLYRILFLLYAEASPELGVLPAGATEYDTGYSLDRLRELTLVPLASQQARHGTHIFDSLAVLFRLVDQGHVPPGADEQSDGLVFHSLRADLFKPDAIAHIADVKLGNEALQSVLAKLLLTKADTKKSGGRERGFISYVELGINQLGAVYEGLMSYTGFFAEQDLYEVARGGDAEKGSWVVPVDRADGIAESDFVKRQTPSGEWVPVKHERGSFVFRLSGRARQQSASYYTPEVLTKFVVGQALEELLDPEASDALRARIAAGASTAAPDAPQATEIPHAPRASQLAHAPRASAASRGATAPTADEILSLTVCEPALGSGAFAIEATRQLAEQYLARKQAELGQQIPPEDYPTELQRAKAYIALHNVYGVDLNATAVEFAEITLWLDTMAKGLAAPWFGLHLKRGNSLIGARRAVYTRETVRDKAWFGAVPEDVPLTDIAARVATDGLEDTRAQGRIPHWLLPADGWGSTAESKEAAKLLPENVAALKRWRKSVKVKPTRQQLDRLVTLGYQAEELWLMAYRRLMVAEQQSRRAIPVWGQPAPVDRSAVTREQIETSLSDDNGAYRRLRRLMDAWCALWFWPVTETETAPPSFAEWLDAAGALLGTDPRSQLRKNRQHAAAILHSDDVWAALADEEQFSLTAAQAEPVADVLARHPWLGVCERIADEQGFFHWQLDFATVFGRGGFDLQVGNPPWVRPRGDVAALLAEGDPWWQLTDKPSEAAKAEHRERALQQSGVRELVADAASATVATAAFVGSPVLYPELAGLQPDLYRCFMAATWTHLSPRGTIGLVHPESHFTDEKAGVLRRHTYGHLRRHWQFVNELQLFGEIHHLVAYGVQVYGADRARPNFLQAASLYHPDTVAGSLRHSGEGEAPGFKFEGRWDQRPHAQRIERVDAGVLATWRDALEPELGDTLQARMLYTVNREVAETLRTLTSGARLGSLDLRFSRGWDESIDRQKGYFVQRWGESSWADAILQGPHLHVATPLYKSPNSTMRHNQDWTETDVEALRPDALPVTAYKPAGDRARYDAAYTHWDGEPARKSHRLAWRNMAANTGERTLIGSLVPPGAAHVDAVMSLAARANPRLTVAIAGVVASLLSDFSLRAAPKAHIRAPQIERLPRLPDDHPLIPALLLRTLRLNCVTDAYADLWRECWDDAFTADSWTTTEHVFTPLGEVEREWSASTPLRRAADRRQALVEIDALVALMLGVSADQLCTVYRTQFAVLYGYDHDKYTFDAQGRIVPNPVLVAYRKKGERLNWEDRTHTNGAGVTYTYELPFTTYDREHDMRTAYAAFESRLQEHH